MVDEFNVFSNPAFNPAQPLICPIAHTFCPKKRCGNRALLREIDQLSGGVEQEKERRNMESMRQIAESYIAFAQEPVDPKIATIVTHVVDPAVVDMFVRRKNYVKKMEKASKGRFSRRKCPLQPA